MENFATEPIGEFKEITKNYVDWFNNRRISQKTKGMTPCEYREHALAVYKYSILSNFCVALYGSCCFRLFFMQFCLSF
ncbi:IS3 family transposase (plasmid) [Lactococcus lactis subsp. lactis]|uniref:IS3 family transposase n=2 Tax=Lactococcus lactis TaxID=1358 RepID=A0AAC9QZI0_LACLL|nr:MULTISPECIES: IS3 family transposase [Lactococcus]ARD94816.1 IS3 family transposase [Lactococcus lactis subsp. lactis]MBU6001158.1 IS3 family transposase [Lactococcus lactis]MCM6840670.1 IS3 family transposase [Lactococcus lactis]MCM6847734.1 IS3 family transposase [Lactococcus lactis]MCM6852284.1 IS3 family transposase [Lactococcus lactis]